MSSVKSVGYFAGALLLLTALACEENNPPAPENKDNLEYSFVGAIDGEPFRLELPRPGEYMCDPGSDNPLSRGRKQETWISDGRFYRNYTHSFRSDLEKFSHVLPVYHFQLVIAWPTHLPTPAADDLHLFLARNPEYQVWSHVVLRAPSGKIYVNNKGWESVRSIAPPPPGVASTAVVDQILEPACGILDYSVLEVHTTYHGYVYNVENLNDSVRLDNFRAEFHLPQTWF